MKRIQLFYFTPADLLIPRVDRQCIMRFLDALAQRGVVVEAVSLDVKVDFEEPTRERDLFDVYGLTMRFPVRILPSRTRQSRDNVNPVWRMLVFSAYAYWRLLVRRRSSPSDITVLYFKNYLLAAPFLLLRRLLRGKLLLLFEIHVPPERIRDRRLIRRLDGLVPVSSILARELQADYDIDERRILVAHQGVDLDAISRVVGENGDLRERLGLPTDRKLAVYTGKVNDRLREIDFMLEAARLVPETELVIVGGREDEVARLRARVRREGPANVRFEGFVAPADIFPYQAAADVLLTYYSSELSINKYRASPGKLFEYMASGRPIVTADYPALREALSPGAALFVEPDNPAALAEGIRTVLADPDLGDRLAAQARADVQRFTWDKRAERVIEFVHHLHALEHEKTRAG